MSAFYEAVRSGDVTFSTTHKPTKGEFFKDHFFIDISRITGARKDIVFRDLLSELEYPVRAIDEITVVQSKVTIDRNQLENLQQKAKTCGVNIPIPEFGATRSAG